MPGLMRSDQAGGGWTTSGWTTGVLPPLNCPALIYILTIKGLANILSF